MLHPPLSQSDFLKNNISSLFGMRNGRMHKGVDFRLPEGRPIYAIDDGRVILSRADSNDPQVKTGYGWYLVLEHKGGLQSVYAHLRHRADFNVGDNVTRGQQVAVSGNTGRSTGPHLHFEIRRSNEAVDPVQFYPQLQEVKTVNDQILTTEQLLQRIKTFPWNRAVTKIHPHHTYKPKKAGYNGNNGLELHQNMRNYHVNTRGFNDIAQHMTLLPDGKWVLGRDWNLSPASMTGNNTGAFMVEMVGDFHSGHEKLEGPQLEAVVTWCAFCLEFFKLGLSAIEFHREFSATACPGSSVDKQWFVGLVEEKLHTPGGQNQYFRDLPSDFPAARYTDSLWEKGILSGRPDGTFGPRDNMSRVEFMTLMARSITYLFTYHLKRRRELDVSLDLHFKDLPDDHWATPYVSLLTSYGIVSRGADTLRPTDPINRIEAVTVASKAMGFIFGEPQKQARTVFTDLPASHWGSPFAADLHEKGIVRGYGDGRLGPEDKLTRVDGVVIVAKAVDYVIDENLRRRG